MLGTTSFKLGPRFGVGWEAGEAIEPPGRDGPLSVYLPACPEQYPLIASGIKQPDYMWSCQETSGNLVDLANSPGAVLTARLNVAYQLSVTGWLSKFCGITTEATGSGFFSDFGALWDIGNQSLMLLVYAAVTASGGSRCFILGGGNNGLQVQIVAAGQASLFVSAGTTGTTVYESATPTVHPFVLSYDRRTGGDVRLHTDTETITRAFVNLSDQSKGIGSPNLAAPVCRFNHIAGWVGLDAEAMMDRGGTGNGGDTLITNLGWP